MMSGSRATPSRGLPRAGFRAGGPTHDRAHDIAVIGASAGGVETLRHVLAALPADYAGTICVVLHIPPSVPSVLANILGRVTPLVCVSAYDGAPIRPGVVYVAPPNVHLVLEPGHVRLVNGPRENGHRPAVDPLFRSAADAYGERVVGVVLSGNLDDGTRGLLAIKRAGGLAVAQAPDEASYPSMPASAIDHVRVDHIVPVAQIGALLAAVAVAPVGASSTGATPTGATPTGATPTGASLEGAAANGVTSSGTASNGTASNGTASNGTIPNGATAGGTTADGTSPHGAASDATPANPTVTSPSNDPLVPNVHTRAGDEREVPLRTALIADLVSGIGAVDGGAEANERLGGVVSAFTCPECHGALWELHDGALVRYRCRVGHSFTESGLVDNKARAVEEALWTALTALEESAAIASRVADRASEQGRNSNALRFRERAELLEQRSAVLREVLHDMPGHADAT